ncbi:oligosaccharide flippase family protein [Pseudomonas sp. PAMC 25886]|uniref:oligosaccharide flippase family protein n=1 Tax=Pseudomonas sp. PAMC 25886 TaxID=1125977 RepID=UPI00028844B0|nr:oligosaccharide flippase family protein [Pseudomonas sp. PAMC 25886]
MSLKKNIISNYIGQFYVTVVGILMLPLYIRYMGAEAYGLVGFFTMLQAWFNLLDLGLTPTIGRETARYRAGVITALDFRRLFRSLSSLFFIVAILGGGGLFLSSSIVAGKWLNLQSITLGDASLIIKIMALCVAIRWVCGLYRGVIAGSERLVWLSIFGVVFATLRFVAVLPVMWFYGFNALVFFFYQFFIAVLEFFALHFKSRSMLPDVRNEAVGWSFAPVKSVLGFSLTIAFTASIWVVVTQTDKLILSSILPLSVYGYFALAVLIAGGVMVAIGPISSAIMPRMAMLHAEGKPLEVLTIYRDSTQLTAIIAGSAAITMAFFAKSLLWAWTGDHAIVSNVSSTLILYALGNGCLAISAFPYYIQYARGNLRLHFIGNIILLVFMVPSIYVASYQYGMIGAGYAWLIVNILFLLFWVWFVHSRLEPAFHLKWLFQDVLIILLPASIVGALLWFFDFESDSRLLSALFVIGAGFSIIATAVIFSSASRRMLRSIIGRWRAL